MNKLFTSILFLTLSGSFYCQSTIQLTNHGEAKTLAPNDIIHTTVKAGNNVKVTIDIKNTSQTQQTYKAKRYDLLLNSTETSSAIAYYCIAGVCYGPSTMVSIADLVLDGGQSASELAGEYQMMVTDLDEAETAGVSHVKYTIQNKNNISDSVQIFISYNDLSVNIVENNSYDRMSVFPNPASDFVSFGPVTDDGTAIRLTNSIGQALSVSAIESHNGFFTVDVSSLPNGVYFLGMSDSKNTAMRKLVVAH